MIPIGNIGRKWVNKNPTKTKTHNIQPKFLDNDYIFALLNVISLFTNVPLNRTVNIILDSV